MPFCPCGQLQAFVGGAFQTSRQLRLNGHGLAPRKGDQARRRSVYGCASDGGKHGSCQAIRR